MTNVTSSKLVLIFNKCNIPMFLNEGYKIQPAHEILVLITLARSQGSDESGQ